VAGAALLGRLTWQIATVVELVDETARVRSIVLDLPAWPGHRAGQHVDVRLTAEDGYQAHGEVSPYLADELCPRDALELRGPIGGYFVWAESLGGPLLLVAGGSGIVPLRAMLRHRSAVGSDVPVRLLYSARSLEEVIYRAELERVASEDEVDVRFTLTREWPEGWSGHRRRVDAELLEEVAWPPLDEPLVYVCGPTGFVETAASGLVALGYDTMRIRTERFGPSGA
jgi:ferredoxin-NADP reductase